MSRRKKEEDPRSVKQRQQDFLTAYADSLNLVRAAEVAKIDRTCHYRWYRKNGQYAEAFKKCKEIAGQYLETEAITRAGEGWEEDIFYQGAPCGKVRRYDSGLMQFLLRGLMPEKYGARQEISGPQGAPVPAKIEVVFVKPDDTATDS